MFSGARSILVQSFSWLSLACWFLVSPAAAEPDAAALFATHCASCHGPGGNLNPDSPVVQGLGIVPANFKDPLFNSREPSGRWKMVVIHVGAEIGYSEKMPAFGDVLSEDEIDATIGYLKSVPGDHGYPDGALNLFLPLNTIKAFPEDEVVWKSDYVKRDGVDVWENVFELEMRVGKRGQVALELVQSLEDGDSDFDKIEVGGKYVLHTNAENTSIVTVGTKVAFPIHGGEEEFLPYLAFGRILNSQFTFQGHTRAKLPFNDFGDGSFELAGIVHWTRSPWPRSVFPALEVVADIPFDRGNGPNRSDLAEVSVIPQARFGLSKRGHVALNLGVQIPVNERDRFDYVGQMSLLWDFADGPFWKGW